MKKLVSMALLSLCAVSAVAAPSQLAGTWRSDDVSGGAGKGSMTLSQDGAITMTPDEIPGISGKYTVKNDMLNVDMGPFGKTRIRYSMNADGKSFSAFYPDGRHQIFKRTKFTQKGLK